MFDYSNQMKSFRRERVRLPGEFREKLLAHRKANRDRLISRLPEFIKGLTIGEASFRPQGSFAMRLVIQTRFVYEEYDIDDGLVLWKHQLVDADGLELTAAQVKHFVREALKDDRFKRQPMICPNCVRVFYADDDEERHHVDFPVYRKSIDANGNVVRELATENGWVASNPTQVNTWFDDEVEAHNSQSPEWGTQLRHLIQLLKRFCRSRSDWDLPNGMKLTMLVAECQPSYDTRIDRAFRELLKRLGERLRSNNIIRNLAHPDKPMLTRTANDQNVLDLGARIREALEQLSSLDAYDKNNVDAARAVWDWIFKSDGFFAEFDAKRKEEEKRNALLKKAAMIAAGARTSPAGTIGATGIANMPHRFYGEAPLE